MRMTTSRKRTGARLFASVIAGLAVVLVALALPMGAGAAGAGGTWLDDFNTARRVATTDGTKISGGSLKLAEGQAQDLGEAVPGESAVYSMVAVDHGVGHRDVYSGTGEKGHLVRYSAGELYQEAYQGPSHYGVSNSRGQAIGSNETEVTALAYDGTQFIYGGTGGSAAEGHVFSFDTLDTGKMCVDRGTPEIDHSIMSMAYMGGLVYSGTDSGHIFSYAGGPSFTDLGQPAGSSAPTAMAVLGGQLYVGFYNNRVFRYDGSFHEVNAADRLGSPVNAFAVTGTMLYIGTADAHLHSYDSAAPAPFTDLGDPGSGGPIASLAVRSGVVFAGTAQGEVWSYSAGWSPEGTVPNGGGKPVNALAVTADNVLYGGTGNTDPDSTGRLFRRAVDVYEDHGAPTGAIRITSVAFGSKKLYLSQDRTLYTYDSPGHYTAYSDLQLNDTINDIDYLATGNQGVVCLGLANGHLCSYHEEGSNFTTDWQWTGAAINSLDHDSSTIYAGLSDGRLMNAITGEELGHTESEAINDLANKSGGGGAADGEYAGTGDGKLYCYHDGTFGLAWPDPPEDITPVNAVAVYGNGVFIGHNSGKIYKWDGSSPTLVATCPNPVISMATGAQGVVVGTSGNNHTYIYDTTLLLHDQGAVPDGTSPRSMCNVNSSIWIGTDGGKLYAHDSSNLGDRGQQVRKQIMIWCMTYDPVNDQYYAGTYQNAHFLIIKPSGEVRDCGRPIDGERELEDILVTSGGNVYGATYGGTEELHNPDGGHLFTFDPAAMKFTDKGRPPSDDDNWWVSSLVEIGNSNHVFGATCNSAADHTGSLFTYDGATFTNLGNIDELGTTPDPALAAEGPRCLTYDRVNSKVYGGTHNPTDPTLSHVFSCAADGTDFTSQATPTTPDDNAINKIKFADPITCTSLYCARNDGNMFSLDPATLAAGTPFKPVASGKTVLGLANGPDNTLLCGTGETDSPHGGHLASYDPSLQQAREIDVSAIIDNQAVSCLAVGSTGVTYCGTKGNEQTPGNWNAGKLFKVQPYKTGTGNTATSTVIDPSVTELDQSFSGQGITAVCPAPSGANEVYVGNVNSGGTATLYRYLVATDSSPDPGDNWPLPVSNQDRILSLAPGPDGKVYIGTGSPGSPGHLMRFDPLRPTDGITDLGVPTGSAAKGIYAITAGPDGKIYLGTGDNGGQGQVFTYDGTHFAAPANNSYGPTPGRVTSLVNYGGKVYGVTSAEPGQTGSATFFRVSPYRDGNDPPFQTETSAVSLVSGPDGQLYFGTGPAGKLVQVTIGSSPSYTPAFTEMTGWPDTLAGKGITAMAGTPDAIYGCAGSQGSLFKWTPSGGFVDKGPLTLHDSGVPAATTDNLGKPYFGTAGDGTTNSVQLVRYNPTAAFNWDKVYFDASFTPQQTVRVDIRNENNDSDVQAGVTTGDDITAPDERALRLKATLTSTDPQGLTTPTVSDWSVTWNKKASVDRFDYPHAEGVYKGEELFIWGADFGETAPTAKVTFGGVPVPVSADFWGPNCIQVTVPQSTTTGSVVITPNGNDPSGPVAFNLLSEPHVTSVSPNSGRVGDVVSVRGSGFLAARGSDDSVTFNGVAAAGYTAWSDTLIKAQVPAGAATGNLVVSVNSHASNEVPFTVQAGGGPTVRITDPSSGAAVKGAVIVNATVQRPVSYTHLRADRAEAGGHFAGRTVGGRQEVRVRRGRALLVPLERRRRGRRRAHAHSEGDRRLRPHRKRQHHGLRRPHRAIGEHQMVLRRGLHQVQLRDLAADRQPDRRRRESPDRLHGRRGPEVLQGLRPAPRQPHYHQRRGGGPGGQLFHPGAGGPARGLRAGDVLEQPRRGPRHGRRHLALHALVLRRRLDRLGLRHVRAPVQPLGLQRQSDSQLPVP